MEYRGLEVPEIARAYLVPEATVAQRIVRAKKKIRDAASSCGPTCAWRPSAWPGHSPR